MSAEEAGADGHSVCPGLVRRLLASQLPEWADLPLRRLLPAGSDNVTYRLGENTSVRLPRGEWAAGQAAKEQYWLPRLAPRLPLLIPVPLAVGKPALGYRWDWSVSRWLPGETATVKGLADPRRTASELAEFLTALQDALPVESNAPNPHDEVTGVPLAKRDRATRAAIAAVQDTFDPRAMTAVWDAALRAPAWDRAPVWFHGDLQVKLSAAARRPAELKFDDTAGPDKPGKSSAATPRARGSCRCHAPGPEAGTGFAPLTTMGGMYGKPIGI